MYTVVDATVDVAAADDDVAVLIVGVDDVESDPTSNIVDAASTELLVAMREDTASDVVATIFEIDVVAVQARTFTDTMGAIPRRSGLRPMVVEVADVHRTRKTAEAGEAAGISRPQVGPGPRVRATMAAMAAAHKIRAAAVVELEPRVVTVTAQLAAMAVMGFPVRSLARCSTMAVVVRALRFIVRTLGMGV